MTILKINPLRFKSEELQPAVSVLKNQGVIAYPTETVYGLGADVYQKQAVERIYKIKGRDPKKPLSVMIASITDVDRLCTDIPEYGRRLMRRFWPGPLTLIFKASEALPAYIVSQDGTVGLRLPDHAICRALTALHGDPITSTSANISGSPEAARAEDVAQSLGSNIDLIIDGGVCQGRVPSTVVAASGASPKIVREGAIPTAQIEQISEEC